MYARAVEKLPEGRDWLYEVKLDGYRCLAGRDSRGVILWSRRANLFTAQFPRIARAFQKLDANTLIDGEIVAVDDDGRISFNLLQHHRSKAPALQHHRSCSDSRQPIFRRFVDITTRRGFREISSSTSRATATHGCQVLTSVGSVWYGPCSICCHDAKKEGETYENRNIISGSLAFHRHAGSA